MMMSVKAKQFQLDFDGINKFNYLRLRVDGGGAGRQPSGELTAPPLHGRGKLFEGLLQAAFDAAVAASSGSSGAADPSQPLLRLRPEAAPSRNTTTPCFTTYLGIFDRQRASFGGGADGAPRGF